MQVEIFVEMFEMEIVQQMGRSGTRLIQMAIRSSCVVAVKYHLERFYCMVHVFVEMFEMEIVHKMGMSGTRLVCVCGLTAAGVDRAADGVGDLSKLCLQNEDFGKQNRGSGVSFRFICEGSSPKSSTHTLTKCLEKTRPTRCFVFQNLRLGA